MSWMSRRDEVLGQCKESEVQIIPDGDVPKLLSMVMMLLWIVSSSSQGSTCRKTMHFLQKTFSNCLCIVCHLDWTPSSTKPSHSPSRVSGKFCWSVRPLQMAYNTQSVREILYAKNALSLTLQDATLFAKPSLALLLYGMSFGLYALNNKTLTLAFSSFGRVLLIRASSPNDIQYTSNASEGFAKSVARYEDKLHVSVYQVQDFNVRHECARWTVLWWEVSRCNFLHIRMSPNSQ